MRIVNCVFHVFRFVEGRLLGKANGGMCYAYVCMSNMYLHTYYAYQIYFRYIHLYVYLYICIHALPFFQSTAERGLSVACQTLSATHHSHGLPHSQTPTMTI